MAIAASYDSTGRYGAQTPFSDNLGAHWAGGQWQVDSTHNAIVAVTNGGNRATEALLTLHFEPAHPVLKIFHVSLGNLGAPMVRPTERLARSQSILLL